MKLITISSIALLFLLSLCLLPNLSSAQACQRTCGKQPIKYPFGTGPGCGDPRFQSRVTCDHDQLTFTTHTGRYPVTSIDYDRQLMYVTDPSMSTCSCSQSSKGFSLDWDAPFSFNDDNIFAFLDCSTSSSPVFRSNGTGVPLCDSEGAAVCSLLYSCQAVSRINNPISTCCVYTPVDLGPSFEMDLQKLQCTSYAGIYGFDGRNTDPNTWQYGVALKYKFNFNNDYPTMCASCERSNGACGYCPPYNSFVCTCPSGLNTTSDCFFATAWNTASLHFPWKTGTWLIYLVALFLMLL
ncbi:hypothetical protein NMG60_11008885 [Bertholletia excelsa]